jgi:predicted dehydrogenase
VGQEHNITPFSDDKDSIDHQVAIMELGNGAVVSFHYCMHSAMRERRFYMCGTHGTIRGDVLSGRLEYQPVGWNTQVESVQPITGDGHGGAEEPMAKDMLACMMEGRPMPTTAEDGVTASITCLGMEQARTSGSVVDLRAHWAEL